MGNGGDAGRGGRRWGAMIGQVWRLGVQVGCQGPGGLCGVSGWSLGVPGRVCRVSGVAQPGWDVGLAGVVRGGLR